MGDRDELRVDSDSSQELYDRAVETAGRANGCFFRVTGKALWELSTGKNGLQLGEVLIIWSW